MRGIQNILPEVDELLRDRLKEAGFTIAHILLAIAPDGAGVVRSHVRTAEMGDMVEIAEGAAVQRPENEALD